jgi:lipoprotein NlpD
VLSASRANNHRVRDGESLYSIAFQYDVDVRALALANGLRSPYTIFVGQELSLDLNAPAANAETRSIAVGTPVRNNGVAQAQAGTPARGGVLRRSIGGGNQSVAWRWPAESTRLLRSFGSGDARGIDIAVRNGDPVLAAADGEVVYSGRGVQGSGDLIILRHNDRYLSAYAHNSVMLVSEGTRVKAGEKIAEAGTNLSGDPLLHFEIREDGKSIDPVGLLPRR